MAMKRLIFVVVIAMTVPAFGLTVTPRPGDGVGVLRISGRFEYRAERSVASTIQNSLRGELEDLGFEAFDARETYDDLLRHGPGRADYYVEVVSGYASGRPMGAVGAAVGDIALEVGVVVSRVAAQVRLYDGRTLNVVETYDLQKDSTAVVPTGVGFGGRSIWAAILLPFVQYGQYRSAAHAVAHQAALRIAGR
jgi:hypothetical protein